MSAIRSSIVLHLASNICRIAGCETSSARRALTGKAQTNAHRTAKCISTILVPILIPIVPLLFEEEKARIAWKCNLLQQPSDLHDFRLQRARQFAFVAVPPVPYRSTLFLPGFPASRRL